MGASEKDEFVRMMQAMASFFQVEILTYCIMSNHFHILVKVPKRPVGFDMSYEEVMRLWEKVVGDAWRRGMKRQFEIYETNGCYEVACEEWRKRMVDRMFSLSEFVKALKQRFTQWFNGRRGRAGTLWEGRYKSVMVQEDESAMRTMAAYIDLNPVRAEIVVDPGDYKWCGYSEAMRGSAVAMDGIARALGYTVDRMYGRGLGQESVVETAGMLKRRRLRALLGYRQILGVAGLPIKWRDGTTRRKGISERVSARLVKGTVGAVEREQLMKRVRHFTDGVIVGGRQFIDGWFEGNRKWFGGRSQTERKDGARPIMKGMKGLYNLRELKSDATS